MIKKKRGISIVITIWHGMTIQGLYCYLDMDNNTVTYHKCSHVPNLSSVHIYSAVAIYAALPPGNLFQ